MVAQYWGLFITVGVVLLIRAVANQVERMKRLMNGESATKLTDGLFEMAVSTILGVVSLLIGLIGLVMSLLK